MKVLVTGSRHWPEEGIEVIENTLARAVLSLGPLPRPWTLLSGRAKGADLWCETIWQEWGHVVKPFPADWHGPCRRTCTPGHRRRTKYGREYCPAAGGYRNQLMVEEKPDICLAFPMEGSRGTWDCVTRARKAKIPVIVTRLDGSMEIL